MRFGSLIRLICLSSTTWVIICCGFFNVVDAADDTQELQHAQALVSWIRSKPDGFFSDDITIDENDESDASSFSSSGSNLVFVTQQNIPKDKTLMKIPTDALLDSGGTGYDCDTLQRLIDEHSKGSSSKYYPYIRYLFGDKEGDSPTPSSNFLGRSPGAWSDEGKETLTTLLGRDLLPKKWNRSCNRGCKNVCGKSNDPQRQRLEQDAYLLMGARSWDDILIPRKLITNRK